MTCIPYCKAWLSGNGRIMTGSDGSDGAAPALQDVYLSAETNETLALNNSSIGRVFVQGFYGPPGYPMTNATISVLGHSSIAGISEGWLRAAPVSLAVNLLPWANLTNTGQIGDYNNASLVITGGAHTSFTNNGMVDTWGYGTTMKFGVDVKGTGTIVDGNNGYGQVGAKIEFGGVVGAGQKITLDSGTLQLDKPIQFHAVIDHLNTAAAPVYDPTRSMTNGAIVLEHTHATHAVLTANELVLKEGNVTVADLHFSRLANIGKSGLFVTSEEDGSTAVTGYSMPGSQAVHVSVVPTFLS